MRVSTLRLTLALIHLVYIQTVDAQILVDTSQTLGELVVTAQRSAKSRFNTPEAIAVLQVKTIRSEQQRTSPEALSALSGLFVQKTNHGGGSPFLRGLTGNQTLLLMDGIRLSNATFRYGPNQYFNTIDLFSIEKIETLRGSGSVQYGSDALGGTVQAFSPDMEFSEKRTLGGAAFLRGATQGMEQTARVELQHSTRRTAFRAGLSWRNFGDLVGGDTTGRQAPGGYRELDFDLKGKLALSPKSMLTLVHQNVRQNEVHVYHKIQLENFAINRFEPQRRTLSYARLEQDLNRGIWKSLSVTTSIHQTEEGRESRKNGSTVLRYEHDQVRSLGAIAQISNVFCSRWSANSGVEIYHDLVNSTRTDHDQNTNISTSKRGLYPDGSRMTSIALFSLHAWDLSKWHITAGLRWNTFVMEVKDEAIGTAKLTPSALVGNAAILRKLSRHFNLFASINSGFRAPNIDDLGTLGIVDFRFETPNYDLRPERSVNLQIGYKLQTTRLQGELYLYRNELRNLITRIRQDTQMVQGYALYQKENAERAYIQGIETAWTYSFAQHWSAQGALTYTYGQNITGNEPMRRIPPVFGRMVLEYTPGNWSFCTEFFAAGKQDRLAKGDTDDNRIPKGGTPGWRVLNLHAGFDWRIMNIRVTALNLFNVDYRTHGSGVNGYGRSVVATIGLRF
ncbi:MAG: TonB-dependent receptor [Saprospiraceae bacterium]|nr:TonB-dependent receptor [Saprospiraceae bacterium]